MEQLGDRLRSAVNKKFKTHKEFITAIGKEGLRGTSMQAVYDYFKNDREPSLAFLRTAADLLSIRLDWLISGNGEPTEDEQNAVAIVRRLTGSELLWEPETTEQAQHETVLLRLGPPAAEALFWQLLHRIVSAKARWGAKADKEDVVRIARGLQRRLMGDWGFFVEMLGPDTDSVVRHRSWHPRESEDFRLAWMGAMLLALPDQRPLPGEPTSPTKKEREFIEELKAAMEEDSDAERWSGEMGPFVIPSTSVSPTKGRAEERKEGS